MLLLKVKGVHLCYTGANVFTTVPDTDVVTIDNLQKYDTIRYEFNVDSKADYSA